MSERGIKLYVADIQEAIDKIEEYTGGMSYEDFVADTRTYDAVVRNFEVIGEAANNVPREIQDRNPDIPWDEIIAMRNKMIHEYFGIDAEMVWETIQTDLPVLKEYVEHIEQSMRI